MQTLVTKDIDTCANLLLDSQLVVFPTETVYGLGAIATDPIAVSKVYKVKNRPSDNPLICHVHSFDQIKEYAVDLPEYVQYLIQEFCPGPISFLVSIPDDSKLIRPQGVKNIIFRIPNQLQTLELIKKINLPLAGPSSNLSGRPSHTSPEMVINELDGKVSAVLDGGESEIGLESTILDCKDKNICKIARPGAIGKNELVKVFEKYNLDTKIESFETKLNDVIPGNKYPHYSPKTPVVKLKLDEFINHSNQFLSEDKIAIIATTNDIVTLKTTFETNIFKNIKLIDMGHSLDSYAHSLYKNLQIVDHIGVSKAILITHNWTNSSLGDAVENRLSKVGIIY